MGGWLSHSQKLCKSDNTLMQTLANFIPLVLANYKNAKLSLATQLNEQPMFIAPYMASILELGLIGLPIITRLCTFWLAGWLAAAQLIVIFIICLVVLLLMFVAKCLNG